MRVRKRVCSLKRVCSFKGECIGEKGRRKKERRGGVFVSRPSRANEKFLQRKVGYCNTLDERVNLRKILKPSKISVKKETNPQLKHDLRKIEGSLVHGQDSAFGNVPLKNMLLVDRLFYL